MLGFFHLFKLAPKLEESAGDESAGDSLIEGMRTRNSSKIPRPAST